MQTNVLTNEQQVFGIKVHIFFGMLGYGWGINEASSVSSCSYIAKCISTNQYKP